MNVVLTAPQISVTLPDAVIDIEGVVIGVTFTVTDLVAKAQPLMVTEYVVVEPGLTVIAAVVAPVLQT